MTFTIVLRYSLAVVLSSITWAQADDSKRLTIEEAVALAQKFPSVIASQEQVNAAAAGIRIARMNYLPSMDALGQVNRATRK